MTEDIEDEFFSYVLSPVEKDVEILDYWQRSETARPSWFLMAMDYLPIHASSVPCERVFSSSSETMTKRRSRIKPDLLEALQMAKLLLKKARLDFTQGWMTDPSDLEMDSGLPGLTKLLDITNDASDLEEWLIQFLGDEVELEAN